MENKVGSPDKGPLAPLPKLRTRYQRSSFAVKLAGKLTEHQDVEVQRLALMIEYLLAAPVGKVKAMLEIELSESPELRAIAMQIACGPTSGVAA